MAYQNRPNPFNPLVVAAIAVIAALAAFLIFREGETVRQAEFESPPAVTQGVPAPAPAAPTSNDEL